MSLRTGTRWSIVGLVGLAVVLLVSAALKARDTRHRQLGARSVPLVVLTPVKASERRDLDIAFYARRADEDRQSAGDRLTLAALLFERSRTGASASDLARAEALTRESLALREQRNGAAFELLATVLMARHAFGDALHVARRADSLAPNTPSHLALLGEIALELGDYEAAERHFRAVHYDGKQITVGARVARWYELTGRAATARSILEKLIAIVDRRDDLPGEQVAWFHYRLGELHLRLGDQTGADSVFQRALDRNPDDVRALGGMARTALARSDWRSAIEYGERATTVQLDPATLGAMSVAYATIGDSAMAAQFAQSVSVSALAQPGTMHRASGLFLLDHGTETDRDAVLRRARHELRERRDVYGHDLLAWALFRTGQLDEARREMRLALAQRTEDVVLAAHARAIGHATLMPSR